MPEFVNYLQMKEDAVQHALIGRHIKKIEHVPRTLKSTGKDAQVVGENLESFRGTITSLEVKGTQIAIEIEVDKNNSVTIVWQLAEASTFCWITESDLFRFPFHHLDTGQCRTNTVISFTDSVDLWVLIDCFQAVNHPTWSIFNNTSPHLNSSIWNLRCPDMLREKESWLQWTSEKLKGSKYQNCSLAKLLTSKEIFGGVGAYLRSEALARLWRNEKILPWAKLSSPKTVSEVPIEILKLHAVLENLWEESRFWHKRFDIRQVNLNDIRDYLYRHLLAYRKQGALCYKFIGFPPHSSRSKPPKVYTFVPSDVTPPLDNEEWALANNYPLKTTSLGVGPIWWHSLIDISIFETLPPLESSQETDPKQKTEDMSQSKGKKRKRKHKKTRPNAVTRNRRFHARILNDKLNTINENNKI